MTGLLTNLLLLNLILLDYYIICLTTIIAISILCKFPWEHFGQIDWSIVNTGKCDGMIEYYAVQKIIFLDN